MTHRCWAVLTFFFFFGLPLKSESDLVVLSLGTNSNIFLWGKLALESEQEGTLSPFSGKTNTCVGQQNVPMASSRPTGCYGKSVFCSNTTVLSVDSLTVETVKKPQKVECPLWFAVKLFGKRSLLPWPVYHSFNKPPQFGKPDCWRWCFFNHAVGVSAFLL